MAKAGCVCSKMEQIATWGIRGLGSKHQASENTAEPTAVWHFKGKFPRCLEEVLTSG